MSLSRSAMCTQSIVRRSSRGAGLTTKELVRCTSYAVVFPDENLILQANCAHCQLAFRPGDICRSTVCSHAFHATCMERFFSQSRKCPTCQKVLGHPDETSPQLCYTPNYEESPALTPMRAHPLVACSPILANPSLMRSVGLSSKSLPVVVEEEESSLSMPPLQPIECSISAGSCTRSPFGEQPLSPSPIFGTPEQSFDFEIVGIKSVAEDRAVEDSAGEVRWPPIPVFSSLTCSAPFSDQIEAAPDLKPSAPLTVSPTVIGFTKKWDASLPIQFWTPEMRKLSVGFVITFLFFRLRQVWAFQVCAKQWKRRVARSQ